MSELVALLLSAASDIGSNLAGNSGAGDWKGQKARH